jgi:hypothetical protein
MHEPPAEGGNDSSEPDDDVSVGDLVTVSGRVGVITKRLRCMLWDDEGWACMPRSQFTVTFPDGNSLSYLGNDLCRVGGET